MSSAGPSSDHGSSTDEEMRDAQDRIREEGLAQQSPPSIPSGTNNRRTRNPSANGHVNPVQRLVGLHQWENNEQLSDVVVRFGNRPEDVFHGHKVILSSWSLWFQNAFMNPAWKEANSKVVTLHGDEPTAVHLVLRALYLPANKYHISEPWLDREDANAANVTLTKRVLFNISVWAVADKYDCPHVKYWACAYATTYLNKALVWARNHTHVPGMPNLTDLEAVVQAVYSVAGHRPAETEPLRRMVLEILLNHKTTSPYGQQGSLAPEVRRIADRIPQFGADMFIKLTMLASNRPVESYLEVISLVACPSCNQVFGKPIRSDEGHCISCGARHNWGNHLLKWRTANGA